MDEDELFNPDYTEVDRVLDESVATDSVTNEVTRYYLVKWQSMAYEDSTWELQADVDKKKIEEFQRYRKIPSEEEQQVTTLIHYCQLTG